MYVRKCIICGKMFTTNRSTQKTCSEKCSLIRKSEREEQYRLKTKLKNNAQNNVSKKKKERQETCKYCGKEFTSTHNSQKYCTVECRDKARHNKRLGTRVFECEFCGELFEADAKRRFCTVECRRKAESARKKKRKPKKPKLSLEQVAKLSREEGLSYGEYVKKYGL